MSQPKRIQRKRTKGWRMPAGAVYVGRPTKWGNPFGVHFSEGGKEAAVKMYRAWIFGWKGYEDIMQEERNCLLADVQELRGKDLACWCPLDQRCHADVLLELANQKG